MGVAKLSPPGGRVGLLLLNRPRRSNHSPTPTLPPCRDLAAATYRGDLFARFGFTLWGSGWYGGHYLPGYSLLAPALGALMGERTLLASCAIASAVLFGLIAQRMFQGAAARAAGASFALCVCVGLLSGRVAYGLGIAVGLLALLALIRGWAAAALILAVLASLASPVAGAFLALGGLTLAIEQAHRTHDRAREHGYFRLGALWRLSAVGLAFATAALALHALLGGAARLRLCPRRGGRLD